MKTIKILFGIFLIFGSLSIVKNYIEVITTKNFISDSVFIGFTIGQILGMLIGLVGGIYLIYSANKK